MDDTKKLNGLYGKIQDVGREREENRDGRREMR
jgi:hypothetical protein